MNFSLLRYGCPPLPIQVHKPKASLEKSGLTGQSLKISVLAIWVLAHRLWEKSLVSLRTLQVPLRGDKWLRWEFIRVACSRFDLARLNHVRVYMQVVFLSNVLGASVHSFDKHHLCQQGGSPDQKLPLR